MTQMEAVRAAFDRRVGPGRALAQDAESIALACRAMAARFRRGGKLLVFGGEGAASDARHVAVEFVHPAIVGKRALPAVALTGADQVRLLGSPADIALGISPDGRCAGVLRALEAAHERGMSTVALVGGDGGGIGRSPAVEHVVTTRSGDPCVVKEVHVTAYHVLWELVHVFLEQTATQEPEAVR